MKSTDLERVGYERLREVLAHVPGLIVKEAALEVAGTESRSDFVLCAQVGSEKEVRIIGEVKAQAWPKTIREVTRNVRQDAHGDEYIVFVAPYVSPESARLCEEAGVGYLDLSGNGHLAFANVYYHVEGKSNRFKEDRPLKSLFSPKASRVLQVLLRGPLVPRRVKDLADGAKVSWGLVSKVRTELLNQEWAVDEADGIRITQPDAILDAWKAEDRWDRRTTMQQYSLLTMEALEIAERSHGYFGKQRHAFTQWFAAHLRCPHVPPPVVTLYVEEFPMDIQIKTFLNVRRVDSGGRLRLVVPDDEGVFLFSQDVDGLPIVSDVQIYLDAVGAGLRGEEAAEELRTSQDFSGGWR